MLLKYGNIIRRGINIAKIGKWYTREKSEKVNDMRKQIFIFYFYHKPHEVHKEKVIHMEDFFLYKWTSHWYAFSA